MELRSLKRDGKALEASTIDNNRQVHVEIEKAESVEETTVGENAKENQKLEEALMDENKREGKASETLMEEDQKEYEKVEEASLLADAEAEAESSRKKTPKGLKAKTKIVKTCAKKFVKPKKFKVKPGEGMGEKNETTLPESNEGTELDSTMANDEEHKKVAEASLGGKGKEANEFVEGSAAALESSAGDGKIAEASLGGSAKEVNKVIDDSAGASESSVKDDEGAEASVEAEFSEKNLPKGLKARTKNMKTHRRRLIKAIDVGGPHIPKTDDENETISQGAEDGMEMDLRAANNNENEKDAENSPGREEEVEKVTEDSAEAPENAESAKKKTPRRFKAKAKTGKIATTQPVKTNVDKITPRLQENAQEKNDSFLDGNNEGQRIGKTNDTQLTIDEECQQKIAEEAVEKNEQNQPTHEKAGLTEVRKQNNRKRGRRALGQRKKLKKELAVTVIGQENKHGGSERIPEGKEKLVDPKKTDMTEKKKEKLGGLIFMCNAKTKPDCFHFRVMGVSGNKKDLVMGIKPGLKLFLYDYDLKLLYGIFQASSLGGMNLERKAFGGSFPAQVRFKVIKDCNPLPESQFRKAIKENYNNKNKFKTELTPKQVFKLKKLFRPAAVPTTAQLTHARPFPVEPVARDSNRKRSNGKRSDKDHRTPSSSRTHSTQKREMYRRTRLSSPRRREEPRDLYLSEREYRAYGLKRVETSPLYPMPPDPRYRDLDRGHVVALDPYHRDLDQERLLRHADIERHERREPQPLHPNNLYLAEREFRSYDHLNARRERLAPQDPPVPADTLDLYARDPYYTYAAGRPSMTYLASSGREDGLYSRYATADSLSDYYRTHRYHGMADNDLPSSSVASRYAYTGRYDSYR